MAPLKIQTLHLPVILLFLLCGLAQPVMAMGNGLEPPRITKEKLLSMMGNPEVTILDVRESESYKGSQWKIRGATREDPTILVKTWAEKYPKDKTLVLYCS